MGSTSTAEIINAIGRRKRAISPELFVLLVVAIPFLLNVAVHFPHATDPPVNRAQIAVEAARYYDDVYASPEDQQREKNYVRLAEDAARKANIRGMIEGFVATYRLSDKRVLEVGAGRGYLQDVVPNYVGLDISRTAIRFFHKPFISADVRVMPFQDGEFDAAWTVWTLEHVPNPESALSEIRRVVKPGGYLLLAPAWYSTPWAAEGYPVRPYSAFGLRGKLIKASIAIETYPGFWLSHLLPGRALRLLQIKLSGGPSKFHYVRLTPNYQHYWMGDSDAVNSLDPYEMALWFESRGDQCMNCRGLWDLPAYLIIRLHS